MSGRHSDAGLWDRVRAQVDVIRIAVFAATWVAAVCALVGLVSPWWALAPLGYLAAAVVEQAVWFVVDLREERLAGGDGNAVVTAAHVGWEEPTVDERAIWAGARSLEELGERTAGWLARHPYEHLGGWSGEVADRRFSEALAAAARAGYVAIAAQSGRVVGDRCRRAAVTGLCIEETAQRLLDAIWDERLIVDHGLPRRWRSRYCGPVIEMRVTGQVARTAHLSHRAIAAMFDGARPEAWRGAHQVTMFDPVWGDTGWLCAVLEDFAARASSGESV